MRLTAANRRIAELEARNKRECTRTEYYRTGWNACEKQNDRIAELEAANKRLKNHIVELYHDEGISRMAVERLLAGK